MTVADLITELSKLPRHLPVLVQWEGTLNLVRDAVVDPDINLRIVEGGMTRLATGAVVIDGEYRVHVERGK